MAMTRQSAMLAFFVALTACAAATGWLFPPGEWYASLERPWFAPPDAVFPPVWTVLYVMIAVAGWLVWREKGWNSREMVGWAAQLALNALWTPLFFGFQMLATALVELALLWAAVLWCVLAFRDVSRTAMWLFVPYFVWISYAWLLNLGYWVLN